MNILRLITIGAAVAVLGGCATATRPNPPPRPVVPVSSWGSAPYDYLGAGGPTPVQIMKATGVRAFALAFVVSGGGCTPVWNGADQPDPLSGSSEAAAITAIRAAGGDVSISFGGAGDTKLGVTCTSPGALAGVYQRVISTYRLRAIDVDLEDTEVATPAVRLRIISALAIVRQHNPKLFISVTMASSPDGPDANGLDLIARAAASGLYVDAWTIMPFDFVPAVPDMSQVTMRAAEGLKADLMNAYHESAAAAYKSMGISSVAGKDNTGDIVTPADFQVVLAYVQAHNLARFTFWSVNRDRPCVQGTSTAADSCSGVPQLYYAFTQIIERRA
jgi:chitinase